MPRKKPVSKSDDAEKDEGKEDQNAAEEANIEVAGETTEEEGEEEEKASKKVAKKKSSPQVSAMAQARALVTKMYEKKGEEPPFVDTSELTESLPHIPTGSFVLNYLIGGVPNKHGIQPCPGWPRGRISQIYGKESSGKTTLGLKACAQLCSQGETVLYVDYEQAIDLSYAKSLGVPIDNPDLFELVQPRTLEEGLQIMLTYANFGVALIVIDSVGAGVPTALANRAINEAGDTPQVAAVARFWSANLPQLATTINKSKTTLFGISQTRKQISSMPGVEDVVQGGNAWSFYASVKVALRYKGSIKSNRFDVLRGTSEKMALANHVEAVIRKSKVSPNQNRSGDLFFTYGVGIDNLASAFQIGVRTKVIHKAGAMYSWNAPKVGEIKEKGEDRFRAEIRRRGLTDTLIGAINTYLVSHAPNLEVSEDCDDDDMSSSSVLDSLS